MQLTAAIPPPSNKVTHKNKDAYNSDIINLIHEYYHKYNSQVKDVAHKFKGDTVRQTALNIYNWLANPINIKYVEDSHKKQIVKSPRKFVHDKQGDCKSYSVFAASILKQLGLPVCFRYASYNGSGVPSHVYVVTKDEKGNDIIIDGTVKRFDYERKVTDGIKTQFKNYCMELHGINGPRARRYNQQVVNYKYTPVGRVQIKLPWGGKIDTKDISLNNIKAGAKKLALAPARAGFLAAVKLNVRNLAANLAQAYGRHQGHRIGVEIWENKFGGDRDSLLKAIQTGQHKKALFGKTNISGAIGAALSRTPYNAIGVEPVTTTAATVAALPLIKEFVDLLKGILGNDALPDDEKASIIDKVKSTIPSIFTAGGGSGGVVNTTASTIMPTTSQDFNSPNTGSMPSWLLPAGLAALGLLILKK